MPIPRPTRAQQRAFLALAKQRAPDDSSLSDKIELALDNMSSCALEINRAARNGETTPDAAAALLANKRRIIRDWLLSKIEERNN